MGLFDSLFKGLFGGADPGGPTGQGAKVSIPEVFQQTSLLPAVTQLTQAGFVLGISPQDLFGDALLTGAALAKAKAESPGTVLDIALGQGVDINKVAPKFPDIFQKIQDKGIKTFQNTFEKLSKVPAFASIFSQASGGPSPLQGQIDSAFGQLGEFALGAAAKTGLLNNSLIQAKALAPLALQKAQFEFQQQNAKEAQALGFAGAPALAGVNPLFNQAVPSQQSFFPAINASAQLSGNLSAQNQLSFLDASKFNSAGGADLFGSLLGFGTFAGAGGFSGKGAFAA